MSPQDAVDLCRQAIITTLILSAPVLIAGLLVGLIVGLLQALTQVQEQTVAFVPKLLAMFVVLAISLPWLLTQMSDYMTALLVDIPNNL
jgi:flagellar biosynthetic protein FliQ